MKILLDRQIFLAKLEIIARNSNAAKTVSGIHKHVLIKFKEKKLSMSSWNEQTALLVGMTDGILETEGSGAMLIPIDKLMGVVANSSTKKIKIESTQDTKFVIKGNGISSVNGMPLTEFPKIEVTGEEVAEMKFGKFVGRVKLVASAAAGDTSSKAELKGILWDGSFVALDGSVAAFVIGKKLDKQYILPKTTAVLLSDLYNQIGDCDVKISSNKDHTLIFRMKDIILVTTLINAKYPLYQTVLDKTEKSEHKIEFSRDEMKNILRRCQVFDSGLGSGASAVILNIADGKLRIQVGDNENHAEFVKTAKVDLKLEDKIFLKIEPFLDLVNAAVEDLIEFEYSNATSPVFVKQKSWIYFVMPLNRKV